MAKGAAAAAGEGPPCRPRRPRAAPRQTPRPRPRQLPPPSPIPPPPPPPPRQPWPYLGLADEADIAACASGPTAASASSALSSSIKVMGWPDTPPARSCTRLVKMSRTTRERLPRDALAAPPAEDAGSPPLLRGSVRVASSQARSLPASALS
eukprot:scaffold2449_cov79-Isochrysis_galbana.AAC.2